MEDKADIHSMRKITMDIGSRFTRLVLKELLPRVPYELPRGIFVCDCGVEKEIRLTHVRRNLIKSCGCWARDQIRITGRKPTSRRRNPDSAFTSVYGHTRSNARDRGYSFNLTKEQLKTFHAKDCHYCGSPPSTVQKAWKCTGDGAVDSPSYTYNGVDRVDNNIGYEIGNCVTCCIMCNRMKMHYTKEGFIEQCQKIINKFNLERFNE